MKCYAYMQCMHVNYFIIRYIVLGAVCPAQQNSIPVLEFSIYCDGGPITIKIFFLFLVNISTNRKNTVFVNLSILVGFISLVCGYRLIEHKLLPAIGKTILALVWCGCGMDSL